MVISLTDEGNSLPYQLPTLSVDPSDAPSTYIGLDPAGDCHSITVQFTNLQAAGSVALSGIELNAKVPFDFDLFRFLVLWAVIMVLYELRPQSHLFSTLFDPRVGWQRNLIFALVVVQAVAVVLLASSNTHFVGMAHTASTENYFQYQKLAHALLEGQLYLDDTPSQALLAMDNPYDTNAREAAGVPYLWDHAYFKGKYYVYFGVLPCLVFFLPCLAATGTDFPTWLAVAICNIFFVAGRICRRWFPRTSVGAILALDMALIVASGVLITSRVPSMYFLPEAMSLALVAWGLGLWIGGTSGGEIRVGRVGLGGLLIALTLAARPQMVLCAVLGVVLVWPFLRGGPGYDRKRGKATAAIVAVLVPFAVVAMGVCLYNYLRFGSFLDFGANYNLTTNDMIHRGFHLDRIPFGLFAYLLQPPVLGSQFPFLHSTYLDPSYQGVTISEPMFGGYFFLYPITLVILALPRVAGALKRKGLLGLVVTMLVLAFVVVNFDIQGAGILMRYFCDFGIFVALPAVIVFLELAQIKLDMPMQAGYTQMLEQRRGAAHAASNSGETISVMRIALYFMFVTLLLTVVVAVLLWTAFGLG